MVDGKIAEAAAIYRELVRGDQISTPPSPYTGADLFALGSVLVELNRMDDAKWCFVRALTLFEDDPVDAAQVRLSLGGIQVVQGLFAEAENNLKIATAALLKNVGENDIRTARAFNVSSWLYTIWGRLNEAEEASGKAEAIANRALPPDSPEHARFLDYRAEYLAAIGRYAEAERTWRRATTLLEKRLGDSSPQYDSVYLHLAQAYSITGDYKQAQDMLKRFLAIEEKLIPGGSLAQAVGLAELGNTYTRLRQYSDAESTLTSSIVMLARLPDPVPLTNALLGTYLGDYYMTQGRWSDAESSYRGALELRQAAAPASTLVGASLKDLAGALDKLKRKDEAKKYKERAQEILAAHYNPGYSGDTVDVKAFREK